MCQRAIYPEAIGASEALMARGLMVTLDYLGENTHSEAEALAAKATYLQMLDRIAQVPGIADVGSRIAEGDSEDPRSAIQDPRTAFPPLGAEPLNISIKLTQCGLDQGEAFAEANYREVVRRARERGTFVRIDMEASEYTQRTVEIVERVFREFPNTGTVLQSYLHRTDDDVADDRARGAGAAGQGRVPGAGLGGLPGQAPGGRAVRQAGQAAPQRGLQYPALATHDEEADQASSTRHAHGGEHRQVALRVPNAVRNPARFAGRSLRKQGYNVRVYVPFGDAWYPYFTRRLAETARERVLHPEVAFQGLNEWRCDGNVHRFNSYNA